MKKILMLLMLLSGCLSTAFAQKNYEYDVLDLLIGGKAGASAGFLTKQNSNPLFGPYGGLYAELYLNKRISMSLELAAAHKGADDIKTSLEDGGHTNYQYRMDYINTSYLFNYHFTKSLALYTGLTVGRLVNAKRMVCTANEPHVSKDVFDDFHKGDFNIPVGLECTIGNHFTIDGRWHWSPRWIAKTKECKDVLGKSRHQFFSVTVGYKVQVF